MPCPNSARERSVTIGFRVTPEQARRIDLMARASGMTKQDYLYKRALEEEVVVRPDVRVYKMLRDEMARVPRAQAHTVRRRGRRGARLDRRLPREGVLRRARPGRASGRTPSSSACRGGEGRAYPAPAGASVIVVRADPSVSRVWNSSDG